MSKILFIVLFVLISNLTSFSQNWGGGTDETNLSGGYILQVITSEYKILKRDNWKDPFFDILNNNTQVTSNLKSISSIPTTGFGIGGLVNKRLTDNFDLRLSPTFILSDRILRYEYDKTLNDNIANIIEKKVQASMFEFPLGIKIKSNRLNNFRAYWLGGAKYSIDLASKKKNFDEGELPINKFLKNKRSYLSYESAIGFDFYFEYFKASTEIKYSSTINNILIRENNPFSTPIDKLKLRHLTVSLILQ
ncbi:type IX secretion/gliding motility protein PorT/SprT [Pedobacter jejuensis]|uniref:PorT family protein n=1 Tax=Pedobacter jejuensis TaxID=1268550 RepID=A0A3N0BPS7_9SPHI|nr:outer membrane beta-barrel protein [Pedobacter jejuensis]RNL51001.1 PorT family protein [Pedobacter jejuensis]